MRVITFASGSKGNCTLVSDGATHLLIDAGISMKRIKTNLEAVCLSISDLSGILITHEHSDHTSGLKMLAKYHNVKIFTTRPIANHLCWTSDDIAPLMTIINAKEDFCLNSITITAFKTSHDSSDSVGFILKSSDFTVGYCTDTGMITNEIRNALSGANIVVIECNHDIEMLRNGPYPLFLKKRVLSEEGHLSNIDCAEFCEFLFENKTEIAILAHLSKENNTPDIAFNTVVNRLKATGLSFDVRVAPESSSCVAEIVRKNIVNG